MSSFESQWQRIQEATQKKMDTAIRRIALETLVRVQNKTPVDSGALRQSWTVSLHSAPTNYNGNQQAITQAKYGDTVIIATNKPYAAHLEYGLYPNPPKKPTGKTVNGYSIQAPKGMVRITVAEIKAWIKRNPQIGIT